MVLSPQRPAPSRCSLPIGTMLAHRHWPGHRTDTSTLGFVRRRRHHWTRGSRLGAGCPGSYPLDQRHTSTAGPLAGRHGRRCHPRGSPTRRLLARQIRTRCGPVESTAHARRIRFHDDGHRTAGRGAAYEARDCRSGPIDIAMTTSHSYYVPPLRQRCDERHRKLRTNRGGSNHGHHRGQAHSVA